MRTIRELRETSVQKGSVEWIGLRPVRREPVREVDAAHLLTGAGLKGDHAAEKVRAQSKRHVTLLQWEHLAVVAALMRTSSVDPALLRRNLMVKGINLLSLKNQQFTIGDALLEGTGPCHPCSRMEETLGPGGYQAVRGHGGINAVVLRGGPIAIGSPVQMIAPSEA